MTRIKSEEGANTLGILIQKYSRLLVLIVMCVILTALSPKFFTQANILNVLRQSVPLLILGLGQTTVLLTGGIDLSMGSCASIAGCVASVMIRAGGNVGLSLFVGLCIGAAYGFVNGVIITQVRLPPFITTFGTNLVGQGLVLLYMGGDQISRFPKEMRFLATGKVFDFPFLIILGAAVLLLFHFLLKYTNLGTRIYHVGANPAASRVSGIDTKKTCIIAYGISGVMAALACIIYIARINTCRNDIGSGFESDAIAAALIGGTSFAGGVGSAGGTAIGAIIVILLQNTMSLLGIKSMWQSLAIGVMMVALLLVDELIKRMLDK